MNRVNGVYEVDCGIRMIIIANNTDIIYTDPASDPYTNGNGNTMLGQNQSTCDNVIGTANYDGVCIQYGGGGVMVIGMQQRQQSPRRHGQPLSGRRPVRYRLRRP